MTEDNIVTEQRRSDILEEVRSERLRQTGKWGTTQRHDMQWCCADWYEMISDYNAWARRMAAMGSYDKARRRMIQVAALAVAAVEAWDQRTADIEYLQRGLSSPLCILTPEEQIRRMRTWFLDNYEDPVEHCPYESAEGGYQFIAGGPHDPHRVLEAEFGEKYSDSAIKILADELWTQCPEWSSVMKEEQEEQGHD